MTANQTLAMSFEQFQASRKAVDDLGTTIDDIELVGRPGIVYGGDMLLHIQTHCPQWAGYSADPFQFFLNIGNQEWLSNDLAELERHLYAYAISERAIVLPDGPVPEGLTREDVLFYICQAIEGSPAWARTDGLMVELVDVLMKPDRFVRETLEQYIGNAEWDEAATLILTKAPHHPAYTPQPAAIQQ